MARASREIREPAVEEPPVITRITEPAHPSPVPVYDSRKRIKVYDTRTGLKHPGTVPETYLREFPHLKQTPSQAKKAGA